MGYSGMLLGKQYSWIVLLSICRVESESLYLRTELHKFSENYKLFQSLT